MPPSRAIVRQLHRARVAGGVTAFSNTMRTAAGGPRAYVRGRARRPVRQDAGPRSADTNRSPSPATHQAAPRSALASDHRHPAERSPPAGGRAPRSSTPAFGVPVLAFRHPPIDLAADHQPPASPAPSAQAN